jgi:hypothetical protein
LLCSRPPAEAPAAGTRRNGDFTKGWPAPLARASLLSSQKWPYANHPGTAWRNRPPSGREAARSFSCRARSNCRRAVRDGVISAGKAAAMLSVSRNTTDGILKRTEVYLDYTNLKRDRETHRRLGIGRDWPPRSSTPAWPRSRRKPCGRPYWWRLLVRPRPRLDCIAPCIRPTSSTLPDVFQRGV